MTYPHSGWFKYEGGMNEWLLLTVGDNVWSVQRTNGG